MIKRQYFDLLVKTSAEGRFPAVKLRDDGTIASCRYRTDDGRGCAVGILIPDEMYKEEMDRDLVFWRLLQDFPELRSIIPEGMSRYDLEKIQNCHDNLARGIHNIPMNWNHDKFVADLLKLECFAEYREAVKGN